MMMHGPSTCSLAPQLASCPRVHHHVVLFTAHARRVKRRRSQRPGRTTAAQRVPPGHVQRTCQGRVRDVSGTCHARGRSGTQTPPPSPPPTTTTTTSSHLEDEDEGVGHARDLVVHGLWQCRDERVNPFHAGPRLGETLHVWPAAPPSRARAIGCGTTSGRAEAAGPTPTPRHSFSAVCSLAFSSEFSSEGASRSR